MSFSSVMTEAFLANSRVNSRLLGPICAMDAYHSIYHHHTESVEQGESLQLPRVKAKTCLFKEEKDSPDLLIC